MRQRPARKTQPFIKTQNNQYATWPTIEDQTNIPSRERGVDHTAYPVATREAHQTVCCLAVTRAETSFTQDQRVAVHATHVTREHRRRHINISRKQTAS